MKAKCFLIKRIEIVYKVIRSDLRAFDFKQEKVNLILKICAIK